MTFKNIALLATVSIVAVSGAFIAPGFAQEKKAQVKTLTGEELTKEADSDMGKVLAALKELNGKPIETLTAKEARMQPTAADAVALATKKDGKDINEIKEKLGVKTQDLTYPAGKGEQKVRIYTPGDADPSEKLPVIVYYHGGGWVIADIDVYDATPRSLAKEANAIVISPEYRHAPENKFPAAHDDATAAYKWALENAAKFGGDPTKVGIVGESAGGNLAANVAIAARDKGMQMPKRLVLVYPVASNDMKSESYVENANAKPLNKPMMEWFVKNVIKSDADKKDPRINLVAANLKGLPPTTIINAQIDPLRSDGEMLAKKLEAAGVDVDQKTYEGVTHEFFGMAPFVSDAVDAQAMAVKDLKDSFKN